MDNSGSGGISSERDIDRPIPFDDDSGSSNVSHSPLNLGRGNTAGAPKAEAAVRAAMPVTKKPAETVTSTERITGVKMFFTKLHVGAMDFLEEQITSWLHSNPGIVIKQTNTVVGEVQGKKTEPNIIVTIWY